MNKLICIALLVCCNFVFGQDDGLYDHGLDQRKWKEIRDGIRYEGNEEGPGRQWTYESEEEYNREKKKFGNGDGGNGGGSGGGSGSGDGNSNGWQQGNGAPNPEMPDYSPPPPPPSVSVPSFGGLGIIGYILIGVFVVLLVFLIYYLFINAEKKGAKIKAEPINFDEVNPVEIPLTELERLLQEALARNDFRGAVRIYFIFIVRDLAQKKWIIWQKEKTNFHYLNEMYGKTEFEDFNVSVSYFEVIWYGKREIDAEKFEKIRPKFTAFLDKLGVK